MREYKFHGTYISMEAHNREVKKLKAEIGYEQDRIDCRNTICNANREGMYRKCAELESQIEALTTDKDELVKVLKQARDAIRAAWGDGSANAAMDKASEALAEIDKAIGGKEDYPCTDHDCYDKGNYHTGCESCPKYKKVTGGKEDV